MSAADLLYALLLGDAPRIELAVVRRHDARGRGVPRAVLDVPPKGLLHRPVALDLHPE